MTDKEIILALRCCSRIDKTVWCPDCPLFGREETNCLPQKAKAALDLINRQKAENEGLKISVEALSRKVVTARNKTTDEFAERFISSISGCFHCAYMKIIRAKINTVAEQMKNNI